MKTMESALSLKMKDFEISYNDFGDGKIPVIFIHGFPFDKSTWDDQLEFLRESHRVIAYDIRGYGNSSQGTLPVSIDLYADDLIEFMNILEIKKAVICGLSMGGYIVLNVIKRYPDRCKAIVLCDTQCVGDSPEAKEGRKNTISKIATRGTGEFADEFSGKVFSSETINQNPELVQKVKQIILSTTPGSIMDTLNALALRNDMCASLKDISVPSLILCGDEDVITPPVKSEFLAENIDNSVYYTIKKAGHLSNLEQPAVFNQHIVTFLNKIFG